MSRTAKVPDNDPVHLFRRSVLSGEHPTAATVLVGVLCRHFGSLEWMEWEPDVLIEEITGDLRIPEVPQVVRDQIWGLTAALTTDLFYKDALFFDRVCNALSGEPLNMEMYEPAKLEEVAWGVLEVLMSDLEDTEEPVFSEEIRVYVGELLKREGLGALPPLEWALAKTQPVESEDPEIAAMQVQERDQKREDLRGYLESRVRDLHRDLAAAGCAPQRSGAPKRH